MSLNSVNTNTGAMVALQALNKTNNELAATQKRISTGYRVSDAKDDGAAFAVAERVRGEVAATQSANEQLGGVKGLLDVSSAGLQNVSDTLTKLKGVVVKLADGNITADQQAQYKAQVSQLVSNIKSFLTDATYNGTNVLDGATTTGNVKVVRNGAGDTYSFASYDAMANVFDAVSGASAWVGATAASNLTSSGSLGTAITNTLTQLNNFGSYSNYVDSQINYNTAKMDAQNAGLGALVDADLAKESAKLQALQIRQQLSSQALGIANQAPQSLLSLFR